MSGPTPIRLVLHNVGAANGETELARKRLMMALRIVLLRNRGLIQGNEESATVQPEAIREMFNGGAIGEHQKLLLESTIALSVTTQEILGHANLGSQRIKTSYGIL